MDEVKTLYEDARVLAVHKPAGRVVVAGRGGTGVPLVSELSQRAGRKLYVVHRLDRDTSGVLLLAKDAPTHRALSLSFAEHEVTKRYLALVRGRLAGPLLIDAPLARFGSGRWGVRPGGKPSTTEVRAVEGFGDRATLVEALPRTGRRHQIRVHLYSVGHPILGDPLYGRPGDAGQGAPRADAEAAHGTAQSEARAPRLMLHASSLELALAGRRFQVAAPLPEDFEAFLAALRAA